MDQTSQSTKINRHNGPVLTVDSCLVIMHDEAAAGFNWSILGYHLRYVASLSRKVRGDRRDTDTDTDIRNKTESSQ